MTHPILSGSKWIINRTCVLTRLLPPTWISHFYLISRLCTSVPNLCSLCVPDLYLNAMEVMDETRVLRRLPVLFLPPGFSCLSVFLACHRLLFAEVVILLDVPSAPGELPFLETAGNAHIPTQYTASLP